MNDLYKFENSSKCVKCVKCVKCHGYKCKYYNEKLPFLSEDICSLCFGRKEICIQSKPELYKIIKCYNCVNVNMNNNTHNQICDLCDIKHNICICKTDNIKYPYYLPY